MSNSLRATKDLRCESKITESGHPNMVTKVTTIMVHVHQIKCVPMVILMEITNLVLHEGRDTHTPALQNFSQ